MWAALLDALAPHIDVDDAEGRSKQSPELPRPTGGGPARALSARMTAIARTGVHGYHSGSEARVAVLTAATGGGWALRDVLRHLESGAWPGLASFYARYRPRHRAAAIGRDWRKATAYAARDRRIHNNHTSGPTPHPQPVSGQRSVTTAEDQRFIRSWRNALTALEVARYGEHRPGLGRRLVLRSAATATC